MLPSPHFQGMNGVRVTIFSFAPVFANRALYTGNATRSPNLVIHPSRVWYTATPKGRIGRIVWGHEMMVSVNKDA